jgi:RND family efflux transporter MFP subunit
MLNIKSYSNTFFSHLSLILLVLFGACQNKEPNKTELNEKIEVRPEVMFYTAETGLVETYITIQGTVEAGQLFTIQPRLSGFLENHQLIPGLDVKKGDTLFSLDNREWQLALDEAKAVLFKAQSVYDIEKRMRGLTDIDTISLKHEYGVEEARLQLNRAALNESFTTVFAPFSGKLSIDRQWANGEFLPAGTELGRLLLVENLQIRCNILEEQMDKVIIGQRVEIQKNNKTIMGSVISILPEINEKSRTGQAMVRVQTGKSMLKPGEIISARIYVESYSGKTKLPRIAMLERNERTMVFKLSSESQEVQWVYVNPIAITEEWILVNNEEINPGDTIAVDQHFTLSHLQKVTPKMSGSLFK